MDFSENKKLRFHPGDTIFEENSPGQEMYYILSGKVDVYLKIKDTRESLVTLESGQFFGELALFNDSQRNAYAAAQTECELLVITRDNLKTIIHSQPDLTFQLVHSISKHLERLTQQYEKTLNEKISWDIMIK